MSSLIDRVELMIDPRTRSDVTRVAPWINGSSGIDDSLVRFRRTISSFVFSGLSRRLLAAAQREMLSKSAAADWMYLAPTNRAVRRRHCVGGGALVNFGRR